MADKNLKSAPLAAGLKPSEATVEGLALKIGKENFNNPKDQYIYSRHLLRPGVLSTIWGVTVGAIQAQMARDRKRDSDWSVARQEHWRHVTTKAQEIIENQALEDTENTATLYRSMIGIILAKCNSALKTSDMSETYTIARTLKSCHDLDERLTGAKAAKAIFDSQLKELEWFASLIEQTVSDPEVIRRIAFSIEARKSIKTTIELKSYSDILAYTAQPHEELDKLLKSAEVIDVEDEGEKIDE